MSNKPIKGRITASGRPCIEEIKPGDVFYTPENPHFYESVEIVVKSQAGYNSLIYVPMFGARPIYYLSSEYSKDDDEVLECLNDSSAVYLGNLGDNLSELFQTLLEVGRTR